MPTLDEIAQQTPGFGERIANLLTGGLYGGLSGRQSQWQDAERAKQMLMSEAANERYMQRRRMEQELSQASGMGIPLAEARQLYSQDPAALFNRVRDMKMREAIAQEQGRQIGLTAGLDDQGPYQSAAQTPFEGRAFTLGQQAGRAEQFKEQQDLAEAKKTATSLGIAVPEGATTASLNALIGREQGMVAQRESAKIARQAQVDAAKAFLEAEGEVVPQDGLAAIAAANKIKAGAPTRTQQAQQNKLQEFEDAFYSGDQAAIKSAYNRLPPQDRKNPNIQDMAAGAGVKVFTLTPKDFAELSKAANRDRSAVTAANSIKGLVAAANLPDVSQKSFNQLVAWTRDKKNKLFMQSPEGQAVTRVIQNYERLISGERKELFGASLTGNELESSLKIVGDGNKANFLSQAMDNIDSIFSNNPAKDFDRRGFMVPQAFLKDAEDARSKWDEVSSGINGWTSQYAPVQSPTGAPVAVPSGTNAPAGGTRVLNFDRNGNLISK